MNEKKLKILIVILLLAGLTFFIYIKMKPLSAFKIAIRKALKLYPRSIVENCEKIFRIETNNFKSGQFKGTYSPGMESFSTNYPYGWKSLHTLIWSNNPQYAPVGTVPFIENGTGKTKYFVKFADVEDSVLTLCEFLKIHNNNAGRWFSTDATKQNEYNNKLVNFKPSITNEYV
jgi:hypothetical protein